MNTSKVFCGTSKRFAAVVRFLRRPRATTDNTGRNVNKINPSCVLLSPPELSSKLTDLTRRAHELDDATRALEREFVQELRHLEVWEGRLWLWGPGGSDAYGMVTHAPAVGWLEGWES